MSTPEAEKVKTFQRAGFDFQKISVPKIAFLRLMLSKKSINKVVATKSAQNHFLN